MLAIRRSAGILAALLLSLGLTRPTAAQQGGVPQPTQPARSAVGSSLNRGSDSLAVSRPGADSLTSARVREAATRARGRRLVVSLHQRRVWWLRGADTVYSAPIAVGRDERLESRDGAWEFFTPRGVRRVISKAENPVWVPPEWHYVELARDSAYGLVRLERGPGVRLSDGSRVVVRGDRIGRVLPDGTFQEVPSDEEVIFGRTLFIPPVGTANRRIEGELGAYKLDMGGGYLLHGTPHQGSIGSAATHGCIRLFDADIAYLYRNVPVGTPVYIY